MKVVINGCFGGFSLSEAAARRMAELGHEQVTKDLAEYDAKCATFAATGINPDWSDSAVMSRHAPLWYGVRDVDRNDPLLVQVVEELGAEANGTHASLEIVEIPDDVSWHIEEYDGNEHIAEDHRTWR